MSSSSRASGSNKRKAESPMGETPEKKQKHLSPLEIKLETLRRTLARLMPIWMNCDPGAFMDTMRHMQKRVDDLTSDMIEQFIATEADDFFNALAIFDHQLLEESPSIGSQPPEYQQTRKRMSGYVRDVRECLEAFVAEARVKPTPSEFADNQTWSKFQQRDDAILCLRPANRRGWPISLMHKAFCDFTRHFLEPRLDTETTEYLLMAGKLCDEMPSAFGSEVQRRDAFDAIFSSLNESLTRHNEYQVSASASSLNVKESGARPDVARSIPGPLILLLEEHKNEVGDSYMQVCRTYEVICGDPKVEQLVKFGNPMFLVCIQGPYLMVCGAIKREHVQVEPLTPFIPMFPGYGVAGRPVQLAYCLQALKEGLDSLQAFWRGVGFTSDVNKESMVNTLQINQPVCPDDHFLRFDDWEGTFKSPMHHSKSPDKAPCFLADLRKPGSDVQVVVKFIYKFSGTYGKATHDYLHSLGLAPRLYSVMDLHHGLVMVVIEYLSFQEGIGGWVELDTFEAKLGDMADPVRKKLEAIIGHLQARQMVHADLRPRNIMVKVDGQRQMVTSGSEPVLSLIDFDWAGVVGEACYPPFLNHCIRWPAGAEGYKKVGRDDDRALLDNWWGAFVSKSSLV